MKYAVLRWTVRQICRVYLGSDFTLLGREHIPARGGYLVCCNHIGTIDPALVPAWVDRDDSWSMAKAEVLEGRSFGTRVLRAYNAFGVVRHSADRGALRRSRQILEGGGVLFLYPEGTRAWDGRLGRAEPGAAFLARLAKVPVLPAAVVGSNQVMVAGSSFPRRRPLQLRFGPPFRLLDRRPDGSKVSHQEASDAIMLRIAAMLPESMWGAYAPLVDDRGLQELAVPLEGVAPVS